ANFVVPGGLEADPDLPERGGDVLDLITLRSNDQFNTTIYGYHDRFRGIDGTRDVLFMNRADIARLGLRDGAKAAVVTVSDDGVNRRLGGLRVVAYDIPEGNCGGYYPEMNVLLPLWHYDAQSKTPAAKSIAVKVIAEA
ncbi:MAG: molybdopterin dinucleotide binding domain-containing protein, partial [Methylobacterium sp.]